jgi:integrase
MPLKKKTTRAPAGSVTIKVSNGRLQLVWRVRNPTTGINERYYLSLNKPDEPRYRQQARIKASTIEDDILKDRFDPTLQRYKAQPVTPVETTPKSLRAIWQLYLDYKRPQCSPSTMANQYKAYTSYLEKAPTDNPDDAIAVRDYALRTIPVQSAKRFIVAINACCKWAVSTRLLERNAFDGLPSAIKLPKAAQMEDDIDPFTAAERDLIIATFATSDYYRHYTALVEFLFKTGCRPSEAVALEWRHIDKAYKHIVFDQALVMSEEGTLTVKAGLKTQERRLFPCNESLKMLLQSLPKDDRCKLVFPSPTNRHIDFHNFANRGWKAVLALAKLKHRKPYQMRHTFITLALESGLSVQDVAKLVGNSPEIIYRHYAGSSRSLQVPEF